MTLHYTEQEVNELLKENQTVHFESNFGFLGSHNGLRRGSLHLLIGTSGGGKSTLVRSVLKDFLYKRNHTNNIITLWLSEESVKDFKTQLAFSIPSTELLHNTVARSEDDEPDVTEEDFFYWLNLYKPDLFIMDNITTSKFYEDHLPQVQGRFVSKLKSAIGKLNCACILIAHTGAGVGENHPKFITMEDVAGGKSLVRKTQFAYILQRFRINDAFFPTLRIIKHRSQQLVNSSYTFVYDSVKRLYSSDRAIPFKELKENFDKRDRL